MRLPTVLYILWARRVVVLAATASCLAGGAAVIWTSVPRYEAGARVVLDYVKPDPVTGELISSKMVTAYVNSQIQFIRDYQVAIPAAEALGMMDSIDLADAYAGLPSPKPEYRMWVAQRIMASVNAVPVEDSNIIEIRYRAPDPRVAQDVAEAVRAAYVDASVEARRASAEASAESISAQGVKMRAKLLELEAEQARVEKASGIMLQGRRQDLDTIRLRSLATSPTRNQFEGSTVMPSAGRLTAVEAQLAQANMTYGPNNPQMIGLLNERARLKAQVAQEAQYAAAVGQRVVDATRAASAALEQQKVKVLDQRTKTMELRLLQDEIDGANERINEAAQRVAELRQLAAAKETSLIPVGVATAKPKPVFPNPALILGGCGVLGLVLGVLLAWFVELLARRVRNASDLAHAAGAPVFGMVPQSGPRRKRAPKPPKAPHEPGWMAKAGEKRIPREPRAKPRKIAA